MTTRLFQRLIYHLLLLLACAQVYAGDDVDIVRAHIESSDDGYKLNARYAFELSHDLEDAIMHGIPLYFTTEIELTRPRWWWTDDKAVSSRQTVRISYDAFLRQFRVSAVGSVQQNFATLDEALFNIRRPSRLLVATKGTLKPGEIYNVSLRMFMDRQFLQKPLQVNAFNNAGWQLSSSKKTFTFKAE